MILELLVMVDQAVVVVVSNHQLVEPVLLDRETRVVSDLRAECIEVVAAVELVVQA